MLEIKLIFIYNNLKDNLMKKILILFASILMCVNFSACKEHTHSFEDWKVLFENTCIQRETLVRECYDCGYKETKFGKPKSSHNYLKQVINPTENSKGYTLNVCDCGDSYLSNFTYLISFESISNNSNVSNLPILSPIIYSENQAFLGVEDTQTLKVINYKFESNNENLYVGDTFTKSCKVIVTWQSINNAENNLTPQELQRLNNLNLILQQIEKLEEISKQYNIDFNSTNDPTVRALQYIRQIRYSTSAWNNVGGTLESNFNEYVLQNQGSANLTSLQSLDTFFSIKSGEEIDFVHLIAILNSALKNGVSNNLYNDLAGWGGDLCQLVSVNLKTSSSTENALYEEAKSYLETESAFSPQDSRADLDALNIAKIFSEQQIKSLSTAIREYYLQATTQSRKLEFLKNAFSITSLNNTNEDQLAQVLKTRVESNMLLNIWCMTNNVNFSEDSSKFIAAYKAFANLLLN